MTDKEDLYTIALLDDEFDEYLLYGELFNSRIAQGLSEWYEVTKDELYALLMHSEYQVVHKMVSLGIRDEIAKATEKVGRDEAYKEQETKNQTIKAAKRVATTLENRKKQYEKLKQEFEGEL